MGPLAEIRSVQRQRRKSMEGVVDRQGRCRPVVGVGQCRGVMVVSVAEVVAGGSRRMLPLW